MQRLIKPQLKAQIDSERERLGKLKQAEAVRLDRIGALQRVNRDAAKIEKTLLSIELACTGIDKTIEALQRQILKPAEDELHHWARQDATFFYFSAGAGDKRASTYNANISSLL